MEGKLSRSHSCLLRSSPTIRSSIHSLSSSSMSLTQVVSDDDDEEKQVSSSSSTSLSFSSGFIFWKIIILFVASLLLLIIYICHQTNHDMNMSASENLLLALVFIAVGLFYLGKNRQLLSRCKTVVSNCCNRLRNKESKPSSSSASVCWYIGDSGSEQRSVSRERVVTVGFEDGVEVYNNGDVYEGEFHKGKSNGSGVYNYFVNGRYEGDWVDGRYDGYGIETWARGSRYRGQYRGGLRHGFGVYTFYTRDTYAGQWFHGQYHGLGLQTCSDGSSYVGQFKFGLKHGLGSYRFRNGDRYGGEYFGDKIHGFGVYHFANGHCYEGSWHEGRKQGYGMYTFRNGEPKCGEWDAGSLKTPLPPLTDSVLRAVQAARKAADDAINLRRVDDQVNNTVMAANRAATAARVAAVKAVQNRMDGRLYDTSYV